MTYAELLETLTKLNPEQLNQTVTVYHGSVDEYYPVNGCNIIAFDDVLDKDHFIIDIE